MTTMTTMIVIIIMVILLAPPRLKCRGTNDIVANVVGMGVDLHGSRIGPEAYWMASVACTMNAVSMTSVMKAVEWHEVSVTRPFIKTCCKVAVLSTATTPLLVVPVVPRVVPWPICFMEPFRDSVARPAAKHEGDDAGLSRNANSNEMWPKHVY